MKKRSENTKCKLLSILMLAVITICMLLSAGCKNAEKTKIEEIQERGVLKVGTAGDYQPMSYLDPETGQYVGFDAELAEDAYKYTSLKSINKPEVRVMENPGGTNEKFARENLPDATLIIHDVNQEIPGLVASGEADVMITEVVEAGYYTGQDDRLAAPLIYEPFTNGEIGMLMPKVSEDLLSYVNEFLQKEKKSGRIDELADDYFLKYIEYDDALAPAA